MNNYWKWCTLSSGLLFWPMDHGVGVTGSSLLTTKCRRHKFLSVTCQSKAFAVYLL